MIRHIEPLLSQLRMTIIIIIYDNCILLFRVYVDLVEIESHKVIHIYKNEDPARMALDHAFFRKIQ